MLQNDYKENQLIFPDSLIITDEFKDLLKGMLAVNSINRFTWK